MRRVCLLFAVVESGLAPSVLSLSAKPTHCVLPMAGRMHMGVTGKIQSRRRTSRRSQQVEWGMGSRVGNLGATGHRMGIPFLKQLQHGQLFQLNQFNFD